MEVQQDFKELLALFNAQNVNYMIVGGYALAWHGAPRYTGDMDLFVQPEKQNAARILRALDEFGFGALGLKNKDFATANRVVQLGYPPVRVDIVTSISGVSWNEANQACVKGAYGDVTVRYICREHYITNKKASGRIKDLADIEALGAVSLD